MCLAGGSDVPKRKQYKSFIHLFRCGRFCSIYGWSRYAQFSLAVLDQVHGKFTVRIDSKQQFNASDSNWGFTTFMPLTELHDPGRGYLVDDKIILEAVISMPKVFIY